MKAYSGNCHSEEAAADEESRCFTPNHDTTILRLHHNRPIANIVCRGNQQPGKRVFEHKTGSIDGFTKRYRLNQLVYFDAGTSIEGAISTEKVIKWWRRSKKIDLIEQTNPELKDLSEGWYETG
jgi:putative endonuclease